MGGVAQGRPCLLVVPRLHSGATLPSAEPSPSPPGIITGLEKALVGCLAFSQYNHLLGLELQVICRN